jgi:hypothetical protein
MLSKAKWNIKRTEECIKEDEGDFGKAFLNTGINRREGSLGRTLWLIA